MRKNVWGLEIPCLHEIFESKELYPLLKSFFLNVKPIFNDFTGCSFSSFEDFFVSVASIDDEHEIERIFKRNFMGDLVASRLEAAEKMRRDIVCDQIRKHIVGETVLDIGCGNGLIAQSLSDKYSVSLLDVCNYLHPTVCLPFTAYEEGGFFSSDLYGDTTLLLTVLHHSLNPWHLLRETLNVTGKRIIIIESVFGLHGDPAVLNYKLAQCEEKQQVAFAVFVDWFYNRVVHDDVPVPYNFTTVKQWMGIFEEIGLKMVFSESLGQDIQIVPELHHLFVLEKKR